MAALGSPIRVPEAFEHVDEENMQGLSGGSYFPPVQLQTPVIRGG